MTVVNLSKRQRRRQVPKRILLELWRGGPCENSILTEVVVSAYTIRATLIVGTSGLSCTTKQVKILMF